MPERLLSGTKNNSREFTEEFNMGVFGILTNTASLYSQTQLGATNADLTQCITQLSPGKRIASGADDPAGLMIADCFQSNIAAGNRAPDHSRQNGGSVRNHQECIDCSCQRPGHDRRGFELSAQS
jgi:hypothetical protein